MCLEESQRVERSWLEQSWGDEYQLLWQPPKSGSRMINAKSSGADLQWLENALSQAAKERPRKISKFDAPLAEKLKRFQQAEGLQADGVAGTQTLVRLNARSREVMPRLGRPLPEQSLQENNSMNEEGVN